MNNETEQIYIVNPSENQSSSLPKQADFGLTAPNQVNLENADDFSNVCRTCATVTEFVIPIYEGEGLQNNIAEKIHKHLPIQVDKQDILPTVVCYQCASTILAWHELVECCIQADAALKTKLLVLTENKEKVSKASEPEAGQSTTKEEAKFKDTGDFVDQPMAPPKYKGRTTSPAMNMKKCDYCNTEHPEKSYKEHLGSTHAASIFHCDECNTYVDKKEFIVHMAVHAIEYASNRIVNIDDKEKLRKEIAEIQKDNNNIPDLKTENPKDNSSGSTPNEFSDHSDVEYFGIALPESVFEAIEDSQDSQQVENDPDKPTTEEADVPVKAENNKKTRSCPICFKTYTAASSYFYHMKNSHKITKDFECELCGKKFGTKASLLQHDAVHSEEYNYSCKDCEKRFRSKASLYIHEQTHNGIKSYSCNQCGSSFRWKTHLLRHMKRHSSEKGHVCDTCGRGFNVRCDLLRHARTHCAGDFACDKCNVKFSQQRYLKVHMEKKHSTTVG